MRFLILLSTLTLAAGAVAQPTRPAPDLSAYAAASEALSARASGAVPVATPPADGEPPPGLYWAGVGLDVVVVAGGTYLLVQGLRLLDLAGDEGTGGGAIPVAMFGGMGAVLGGVALVAGGADLVYVATGGDPALVRLFDPARFDRPPFRGPLE